MIVGHFDTASSVAEVASSVISLFQCYCCSIVNESTFEYFHILNSNLKPLLQFTITDSVAACNHS